MRVHREGKAGRAAVIGERAQHRGKLVDVGAAAAEFARHAGLDQTGLFQQCEIVGDEFVALVARLGAAGEFGTQFAGISAGLRIGAGSL